MAQVHQLRASKEAPIPGARILLIEARFNEAICEELAAGALARLKEAGVEVEHVRVPGALEIPIAAAIALDAAVRAAKPFDGVVAIGCVIRGETAHFEIVAHESARALLDLAVARRLPLGNAILTVENEAQALARAKRSEADKGGEAASAALALVRLSRTHARAGK
jgi:6,7-dimethyl-8-ribityllumazine synthase